jgi:hypothetical protein
MINTIKKDKRLVNQQGFTQAVVIGKHKFLTEASALWYLVHVCCFSKSEAQEYLNLLDKEFAC